MCLRSCISLITARVLAFFHDTASFLKLKHPVTSLIQTSQASNHQHTQSKEAANMHCKPRCSCHPLTSPVSPLHRHPSVLVPRPQTYLKINYLNKPAVRSGSQPLTPEVNNLFEIHYCVERRDRALQDSAFPITPPSSSFSPFLRT